MEGVDVLYTEVSACQHLFHRRVHLGAGYVRMDDDHSIDTQPPVEDLLTKV